MCIMHAKLQSNERPRRNGTGSKLPTFFAAERDEALETVQTAQKVKEKYRS